MKASFNRPTCGYYSGEGKHGGPDPNPDFKENGNPRSRRTADNEDDLKEAAMEWCADEMADGYCKYFKKHIEILKYFYNQKIIRIIQSSEEPTLNNQKPTGPNVANWTQDSVWTELHDQVPVVTKRHTIVSRTISHWNGDKS